MVWFDETSKIQHWPARIRQQQTNHAWGYQPCDFTRLRHRQRWIAQISAGRSMPLRLWELLWPGPFGSFASSWVAGSMHRLLANRVTPPVVPCDQAFFDKHALQVQVHGGKRIAVQMLEPQNMLANFVLPDKPNIIAADIVRPPRALGNLLTSFPNRDLFEKPSMIMRALFIPEGENRASPLFFTVAHQRSGVRSWPTWVCSISCRSCCGSASASHWFGVHVF